MEPFPLMKTRQPVDASTRFRELPLGPRMRPTKLNCGRSENYVSKEIEMDKALSCVNLKLHKLEAAYTRIRINWDLQA
jgi:hypothetical protein